MKDASIHDDGCVALGPRFAGSWITRQGFEPGTETGAVQWAHQENCSVSDFTR